MVGEISAATRTEVLGAIRSQYREASKRDKSRMLDEFVAMADCHRKHAVRLLGQHERSTGHSVPNGRRIYDEAVRQALIVVWEASDRICGKRLKAALPSMVQSLERHGHLDLDPDVRERLFSASASTMDRLLRPVRAQAGSRRRLKKRRKMGSRVPARTLMDWNEPGPGYLEIDLVAHGGGAVSGALHPQPGGHRHQLGVDRGPCRCWRVSSHWSLRGTGGHLRCLPCPGPRHRLRQRQRIHQRDIGQVWSGTVRRMRSSSPAHVRTARTTRRG